MYKVGDIYMLSFWTGSEDLPIYGFLIRATIVYIYIFVLIKVLGQRSMVPISPIDFLFGIIIGDVVGEPLSDGEADLAGPLAAASFIGATHLFLSYMALKLPRYRRIIEDEPIILMENGIILQEQLRKSKITMESFLMDLRFAGAIDLTEVDYAILESNGQISVIKKSKYDVLTPADMNKDLISKGYPSVIISDGRIIDANLNKHKDRDWLNKEIKEKGYKGPKEIFLLTLDRAGTVYISPKKVPDSN